MIIIWVLLLLPILYMQLRLTGHPLVPKVAVSEVALAFSRNLRWPLTCWAVGRSIHVGAEVAVVALWGVVTAWVVEAITIAVLVRKKEYVIGTLKIFI